MPRTSKRKPSHRQPLVKSPRPTRPRGRPKKEFIIRDILDERHEGVTTEYLVEWEDNKTTGEIYEPTWQAWSDLNEEAKQYWAEKQRALQEDEVEDPKSSQSIRAAKRRRAQDPDPVPNSSPPSPTLLPVQRPWKAGTVESARFSISHEEHPTVLLEVPDSYEKDITPLSSSPQLQVCIQSTSNLDKESYQHISQLSDNLLEPIQSGVDLLTSVGHRSGSAGYHGKDIVPDSQELLDSDSHLSTQAIAAAAASSGPTGAIFSLDIEVPESQNPPLFASSWLNSEQPFARSSPQRDRSLSSGGIQLLGPLDSVNDDNLTTQNSLHFPLNNSNSNARTPRALIEEELIAETPLSHVAIGKVLSGYNLSGIWQGSQIVPPAELPTHTVENPSFEISEGKKLGLSEESKVSLSTAPSDFPALSGNKPQSQETASQSSTAGGKELITNIELEPSDDHTSLFPPQISQQLPEPPRCSDAHSSHLTQRPSPVSSQAMADQQDGGDSTMPSASEKLKQVRAMSAAAARATRSPSVIPPRRPSLPPSLPSSLPSQMLPVREATLHNTSDLSAVASDPMDEFAQDSDSDGLRVVLGDLQYLVLLPMTSIVRDVYKKDIVSYRKQIEDFTSDIDIASAMVDEMNTIVERWKLLADHQDLINEITATQAAESDETEAKWAETCSSKCAFLVSLLTTMRSSQRHVAILCRPGRMLDLVEVLLKAKKIMYDRPDARRRSRINAEGSLRVTLLPTDITGGYSGNPADLIICFDSSFSENANAYCRLLRGRLDKLGKVAPLISLVVTHTAEHFEFCLTGIQDSLERSRFLVSLITQTRHEAGILNSNFPAPAPAAASVAEYILSDDKKRRWPLPLSLSIPGIELPEVEDIDRTSGSTIQSYGYGQPRNTQVSGKRAFDDSLEVKEENGKRMRMTPVLGENNSTDNSTRASDSVQYAQQDNNITMREAAQRDIANARALDDLQSDQMTLLLAKVTALEMEIQRKGGVEVTLCQTVKRLETGMAERDRVISKLSRQAQTALKQRALAQSEKEAAQTHAATVSKRLDARVAEMAKLKEEKATQDIELGAARTALANSTVPEIAELANAKEEVQTSHAQNERLERKLASLQRDFEFTRDSYQKASNSAMELASELSVLKEEIVTLQRKTSETTTANVQTQRINEIKEREARVDELEAQVEEYRSELFRKNEELKAKTNGRRETRGVSVPRSPRMGSGAMSPRPYLSKGGAPSRGTSPAPGQGEGMREGAKDPLLFPAARWPHLREG